VVGDLPLWYLCLGSMTYDLCVTWNWEYDAPFLRLLEAACSRRGSSLLEITPGNLEASQERLDRGELQLRALLDRASEEDPRFLSVVSWAERAGARSINPYPQARRCWDKAEMHRAIFDRIHTPYTIILPSCTEAPELPPVDLAPLGDAFTIKPANGGGGAGVVVEAHALAEVREARRRFPDNRYLLQTRIRPTLLDRRAAWFRVISCCGETYPGWWETDTHLYTPVTVADESHHGLAPLRTLASSLAQICGLGLFSSEIALDEAGDFLVVDYANAPIDLRLQSATREGVPDAIVAFIAERLAAIASER
jgi:hypothetical protein